MWYAVGCFTSSGSRGASWGPLFVDVDIVTIDVVTIPHSPQGWAAWGMPCDLVTFPVETGLHRSKHTFSSSSWWFLGLRNSWLDTEVQALATHREATAQDNEHVDPLGPGSARWVPKELHQAQWQMSAGHPLRPATPGTRKCGCCLPLARLRAAACPACAFKSGQKKKLFFFKILFFYYKSNSNSSPLKISQRVIYCRKFGGIIC